MTCLIEISCCVFRQRLPASLELNDWLWLWTGDVVAGSASIVLAINPFLTSFKNSVYIVLPRLPLNVDCASTGLSKLTTLFLNKPWVAVTFEPQSHSKVIGLGIKLKAISIFFPHVGHLIIISISFLVNLVIAVYV